MSRLPTTRPSNCTRLPSRAAGKSNATPVTAAGYRTPNTAVITATNTKLFKRAGTHCSGTFV